MYAYIRGEIKALTLTDVVLEAKGIGYLIWIPISVYPFLEKAQGEVVLFTSFVVRENDQKLYGFSCKEDRDLFEKLINVSGIGPKSALSLIGCLTREEFFSAVQTKNVDCITKVPGIGKKTAERLLVDIKDRLKQSAIPTFKKVALDTSQGKVQDTLGVLLNLGYAEQKAQKAIEKVLEKEEAKQLGLSCFISEVLKNI